MSKPNILVTGGAGFLGSHLCDALVNQANVICVDNFTTGSESNINHLLAHPSFKFIRHDISQPLNLGEYRELDAFQVEALGISKIYHLACPTSPKRFDAFRYDTLRANALGSINVLELAKQHTATIFIASSAVVYGPRRADNAYVSESMEGSVDMLSPRACYDEGKRFTETCAITYKQVFGVDVRIGRLFRLYGPRMPLGEGHMIPDFILAALEGKPLVVYGSKTFSTSLCYVADAVEAIERFMQLDTIDTPLNIGSDQDLLIEEVAKTVIDLTHSASSIQYEDPLLFMSPLPLPDISIAKDLLGWLPITTLKKGIERTIEYTLAEKGIVSLK